MWIGHGGGVLLVDSNRTARALNGYSVSSIQAVGSGLWAIAKDESKDRNVLMEANGEEWAPVPSMKDRSVLDLVQDSKGVFWLVLDGDGVMEVDPKRGMKDLPQHLPRMNVTSILTDSQGRTWCGLMSGGVMVREKNDWKRQFDRENTAVLSLIEDGAGKIWAATSGNGVWVFDGTNWKGMLQNEGAVNVIKMTSDQRVWVCTQARGGLQYWNGTEWKASLETPSAFRCLAELPGGVLMAGSVLDGVYILGGDGIKGESSDGKDND
jgi:ligand-binding sensor domain-containing protein